MTDAETVIPLSVGECRVEDIGHPDYTPKCASDPRADGPFYIDGTCDCGTELILYDDHRGREENIWWDEWWCPDCEDGLRMDWPEEQWENIHKGIEDMKNGNTASLEDLKAALKDD